MTGRRGKQRNQTLIGMAAATIACAIAGPVRAADRFWTNAAGGTYGTPSNWNNGSGPVPTGVDAARFNLAGPYTVNYAANTSCTSFILDSGSLTLTASGSSRTATYSNLQSNGGSLTLASPTTTLTIKSLGASVIRGDSTVTVNPGNTLSTNGIIIADVPAVGTGALVVTGAGAKLIDTGNIGLGISGTGYLTFSDNSASTLGSLLTHSGTLTVQSGADVKVNSNVTISVSHPDASTINVTGVGSTMTVAAAGAVNVGYAAGNGFGAINVSDSGTFTCSALTINKTGIVDFTGGSLNANFDVNGGTLQRTTSSGTLAASASCVVESGGTFHVAGDFNSGSLALTVRNANSKYIVDGALTTSGGGTSVNLGGSMRVGALNLDQGFVTVDGTTTNFMAGNTFIGKNSTATFQNNVKATFNGNVTLGQQTPKLLINSGAQVTINGNLQIGQPGDVNPVVDMTSGTGTKVLTVTGSMTVGDPSSQLFGTFLHGSTVSVGGPLIVNRGGSIGTLSSGGDIAVNGVSFSLFAWPSWAPGKTMTVSGGGELWLDFLPPLSGNTINIDGTFAGGFPQSTIRYSNTNTTHSINGGSTVSVTGGGRYFPYNLKIGEGTGGTLMVDGSSSQVRVTGLGALSTFGKDGGHAHVTFQNDAQGQLSVLELATTAGSVGELTVQSGADLSATQLKFQSGSVSPATATLIVTGPGSTFTVTGTAQSVVGGNPSGSTLVTITEAASFTMAAGSSLLINPSGRFNIEGGSVRTDALTVSSGSMIVNAGTLSIGPSLSIVRDGKLDLTDHNMVVRGGTVGTFNGSTYTGVTGFIVSGRNNGTWNGTGIVTSQSIAAAGNYTTLGIATGAQAKSLTGTNTALWAGQTVSAGDVLVLYTYGGDATLDGKINIDDYVRIDNGSAAAVSGWSNGDFNYDGKINIDDYVIIDGNVLSQGSAFPTASQAGGMSITAVPEPMGLCMTLGALVLATRVRSHPRARLSRRDSRQD